MKGPDLKIFFTFGIVIVLLTSQGCMHINFIGEKEQDKEKHSKAAQAKGQMDGTPRRDTQGEVSVEIQFGGRSGKGEIAFQVKMDAHSIVLSRHPLENLSTLANDQGAKVRASKWEIAGSTDHRVSGTIYFPAQDANGNPMLAPGVTKISLAIRDLGGIPERGFYWNLLPDHSGKRTAEKILWMDDDLGMYVSFSRLWQAIKNTFKQNPTGGD